MFKKIAHANKEKDVKRCAMSKEEYGHLKRFYDSWLGDLDL